MIAIFLAPFYILLNAYILMRLLRFFGAIHERLKHPVIWTVSIIIYVFFMLTPLTGYIVQTEPWHHALKSMSNYWLGVLAISLITTIIFDVARLILNRTKWKGDHPNEKRFKIGGTCAIVIIAVLTSYGFIHAKAIRVNSNQLEVNKVGSDLKIALVADTHIGYSVGEKHIQHLVNQINEEKPDLVVFAGDIFDNEYRAIKNPEKIEKILSGIKSTYGTYACWGNHDVPEALLAGFTLKGNKEYKEDKRFDEFLENSNIKLLADEATLINDEFYLIGRKDPSRAEKLKDTRKSAEELTAGLDKTKPIFVIDHQPKELEELANAGVDVDLSGHTHNGQIFPGNILGKITWTNPNGVKKMGDMYSCVTSGAGIWGPAMRLGTNSEVMILNVDLK